jgi:transmembrane sensor
MRSDQTGGALIDAATEWLIALDAGRADRAAFERWRSADPRNASAFAQVASTWERTAALRMSPDRSSRTAPEATGAGETAHSRRALLKGALAAGAILAAGTSAMLMMRDPRAQVQTAVGERRSVRLPDGSLIELNTDSLLSWRFGDTRSVWLEQGEAAMVVAARQVAPFILHAVGAEAHLTAGRYALRIGDAGFRLIALAGGGRIAQPGRPPVQISAMQSVADAAGKLTTAEVSPADIDAASAWRRGEIVFNGMQLRQAVAEFNRYLERKLIIADPAIGDIRLGGRFFVDDPTNFLRALRQGFDVQSSDGPEGILLRSA